MEPLLLAIINVIALNHGAKADAVANAVSRLVRVNDIALVINLNLGFLFRLSRGFLDTLFLAWCCCALSYSARAASTARTRADNAWRWSFNPLARLSNLWGWCISSGTSASRSFSRKSG